MKNSLFYILKFKCSYFFSLFKGSLEFDELITQYYSTFMGCASGVTPEMPVVPEIDVTIATDMELTTTRTRWISHHSKHC